ncbi:hypothetical protein AB1N83_010618 [Pleurotus pulmonarius]
MPHLPNETVCHIVDLVDCLKTFWTLLTVSHRMSAFAIPALYRDLSFDSRHPLKVGPVTATHANALQKLAHSAKSNKNLRFTTSLSIFRFISPQAKSESVRMILPFLPNLRRLSIIMPVVDLQTLSPVPRSARLTHLVMRGVTYSQDFVRFLEDHPTLTKLEIDGYHGSELHTLQLSPAALPMLKSLSCPLDIAPELGRPSVIDLKIVNVPVDRRGPISKEFAYELAKVFPAVRALHFAEPIPIWSVVSLICFFPNVIYLQFYEPSRGISRIWHTLAPLSVKHIRFTMFAPSEETTLEAFRSIESLENLAVIDMVKGRALRYYRSSKASPVVDITDHARQSWEETIANDVY